MMRKYIIVAAIALVFLGGAYAGYAALRGEGKGDGERRDVAIAKTGSLESLVTAKGTLEPKEYVDVGAQISGLVLKLRKEAGDAVDKGDLIAEIDPAVYLAKVRGGEARLKTLNAQYAQQKAQAELSARKLSRARILIKDRAISREGLEDAEAADKIAKAQLQALSAQIEEAQSTLEGDRANLGFTKIYAPMSGMVTSQSVKEGQTINANQTAPVIVQIADLDAMTARAQVAEADIMKLAEGMPVYFTTLGSNERKWEGKVRQILPAPETINDVVLYNVLADVDNADRRLMPGMTAQMFFVLARAENLPLVPVSALGKRIPAADTEKGKAYEVVAIEESGKKTLRTVIVALKDRVSAAVMEGVRDGESVLLNATPRDASGAVKNRPGGGRRGGMMRL